MPRYDARQLVENIERLLEGSSADSLHSPTLAPTPAYSRSPSPSSTQGHARATTSPPRSEDDVLWDDLARWAHAGPLDADPGGEPSAAQDSAAVDRYSTVRSLNLSILPALRSHQQVDKIPPKSRYPLLKRVLMRFLRLVAGRQSEFNRFTLSALETVAQHLDAVRRSVQAAEQSQRTALTGLFSLRRTQQALGQEQSHLLARADSLRSEVGRLAEKLADVDSTLQALAALAVRVEGLQQSLATEADSQRRRVADLSVRAEGLQQALEILETLLVEEFAALRSGANDALQRVSDDMDALQGRLDSVYQSSHDMVLSVWKGIGERDAQLTNTTSGVQHCHAQIAELESMARDAHARLVALHEQVNAQVDLLERIHRAPAAATSADTGDADSVAAPAAAPESKPRIPDTQLDSALQDLHNLQVDIAYLRFQRQFRGDEAVLKERQRLYVNLLLQRVGSSRDQPRNLLDIACGDGFFLDLWREHPEWKAQGVDLNGAMVRLGQKAGLDIALGDAFEYLEELPEKSFHVITSFQFVEHLDKPEIIRFLRLATRALKPSGFLLVETLNPHSLFSHKWFHLDLTHKRLIFPEVLALLMESTGLRVVETRHVSEVHPSERLKPPADPDLRENFERLNEFLFGKQDYYILAQRP